MAAGAEDKLISVKEAARGCSRNPETVRRWIWSGKLPAEKLGNQLFVKQSDLVSFCLETAIIPCQAETNGDILKESINSRSTIKARSHSDVSTEPFFSESKEGRTIELAQSQHRSAATRKPGSRTGVIERMRKLREEIRTRVGNLDVDATIDQLRGERVNDLTNMR